MSVTSPRFPLNALKCPGRGFPPRRRVLSYADLRAIYRARPAPAADRDIVSISPATWSGFIICVFDGKNFSDAEPIRLKLGERGCSSL